MRGAQMRSRGSGSRHAPGQTRLSWLGLACCTLTRSARYPAARPEGGIVSPVLGELPDDLATGVDFPGADDRFGRDRVARSERPDDPVNPAVRMALRILQLFGGGPCSRNFPQRYHGIEANHDRPGRQACREVPGNRVEYADDDRGQRQYRIDARDRNEHPNRVADLPKPASTASAHDRVCQDFPSSDVALSAFRACPIYGPKGTSRHYQ